MKENESHSHGDPLKFKGIIVLLNDVDVLVAFRIGLNYERIIKNTNKKVFLAGTRDIQQALQKLKDNLQNAIIK